MLATKVEAIAGVKLDRKYDPTAPRGVAGRNSDNTFIKKVLKWKPDATLDVGLRETYHWIKDQYSRRKRGSAGSSRSHNTLSDRSRNPSQVTSDLVVPLPQHSTRGLGTNLQRLDLSVLAL